MATVSLLLSHGEGSLKIGPHPERAKKDAELLLCHLLGTGRAWLVANRETELIGADFDAYSALIERRRKGEPIQYITGKAEFYGLPFTVAPGVLIPRPETEHLVEEVLRLASEFAAPRIADIGTGSGAIAVALARSLPCVQIAATDLSPTALEIAKSNAERSAVADRITFLEGDLLAPVTGLRFEIIASNPPYIPLTDSTSLSVEVREHEPHSALFAGEDGLAIYRRLIPEARDYVVSGGWLVLEIGYKQQPAVQELLQKSGYGEIHFVPDYQGIPRVACGRSL